MAIQKKNSRKNVLLIIMDGYGIAGKNKYNAVTEAGTPNLNEIFRKYPTTYLKASGLSVGLPDAQMGNSEVGHTNIGAGRVVYQDLTFINKEIDNGNFYSNEVLNSVMDDVKEMGSTLHIMGLVSDGGVHSHINHLYAILKLAKHKKMRKIAIHAFADGRDTSPTSVTEYLNGIEKSLKDFEFAKIATLCGRYYAMDRDSNLDRTEIAAQAILSGNGKVCADFAEAVQKSYAEGITDEFLPAYVSSDYEGIDPSDSIICFNYRPDRARQITRELSGKVKNYVCFTQYDKKINNVKVAFKPRKIDNTLGEYISSLGMKQLRIAETEKYAHVTFFFNAGIEKPYSGEDRIIVSSPKVKTYDLKPEMSAYEITKITKEKIKSKKYDLIVLNFANPDMVGHTGNLEAAIKAVETVDCCVKELVDEMNKISGITVLTADHGNAEKMRDNHGNPHTSHTCNPVPLSVIGYECNLRDGGALCDVAPTICKFLGIKKPDEMSGSALC